MAYASFNLIKEAYMEVIYPKKTEAVTMIVTFSFMVILSLVLMPFLIYYAFSEQDIGAMIVAVLFFSGEMFSIAVSIRELYNLTGFRVTVTDEAFTRSERDSEDFAIKRENIRYIAISSPLKNTGEIMIVPMEIEEDIFDDLWRDSKKKRLTESYSSMIVIGYNKKNLEILKKFGYKPTIRVSDRGISPYDNSEDEDDISR